jgi:cyanophycin synthetase
VEPLAGMFRIKGNGRTEYFHKQMSGSICMAAREIVARKHVTSRLLREADVPTPRSRYFQRREKAAAREFFASLPPGPVVMKPTGGSFGEGVHLDIDSEGKFLAAWDTITSRWFGAVIEQFVPGHECRYFVVGDRTVAVTSRIPANVVGDGFRTIS